jgi:cytidylate kinase
MSMTVIAGIMAIVLTGRLQGVREGTIVAALLVCFIARLLQRKLSFIPELLYGKPGTQERSEESMTNSFLYDLVNQFYSYSPESHAPKDAIFEAEIKVIKELAKKESCAIVGRCADYILKDDPNCLRIFLHAPYEVRVKNIAGKEQLTEEKARKKIQSKDRRRADNYRYYTGQVWGLSSNYHLSLDTSLGEQFMDETIIRAVKSNMHHKI